MSVRLVRHTVVRGAGHLLAALFSRVKRANVPLSIAFVSALYIFLRALTGLGYIDPLSYEQADYKSLAFPLNHTYVLVDESLNRHVEFAKQWARFKDDLFLCPDDGMADGFESDKYTEALDSGSTNPRSRTRLQEDGVGCQKERLTGTIDLRRSSGPTVKKQDNAFGVSLDAFPSRRKEPDGGKFRIQSPDGHAEPDF